MKKFLLSGVALVALAGSAIAADLPARAAPPPAPIYGFSWTGFYLGGYVGGTYSFNDVVHVPTGRNTPGDGMGFTGGLIAGYNVQLSPNWVVGIEADVGYQGVDTGIAGNIVFPFTGNVERDWVGRIRGRVGYAMDRTLVYIAGGVSFSEHSVTLSNGVPAGTFSLSNDHIGWNLGAGVEHAFTNNWLARAEFIYDGFEWKNYGFNAASAGLFADRRVETHNYTVRLGLVYKFGGPVAGPAVVKY